MAHASSPFRWFCACNFGISLLLLSTKIALAQQTAPETAPAQPEALATSVRELQEQVRQLHAAIEEIRSESARYRSETLELRRELQATKAQLGSSSGQTPATPSRPSATSSVSPLAQNSGRMQEQTQTAPIEERLARLEEESQLQGSKIDEQNQTKVESASKYRVRLSGIALLNLFSNRGTVDNQDVPNFALAPSSFDAGGNFGGTLRQSEIGLEVFGPRLAGARTSGDVQFDLGGGFPNTANGVTSGLFRLRTATMRLDWSHTSVVAGQDSIFFSPFSPTSFASLIVPEFGYAGNLWAWVPQVRLEQPSGLGVQSPC